VELVWSWLGTSRLSREVGEPDSPCDALPRIGRVEVNPAPVSEVVKLPADRFDACFAKFSERRESHGGYPARRVAHLVATGSDVETDQDVQHVEFVGDVRVRKPTWEGREVIDMLERSDTLLVAG
jgi:hypothetical protein